MTFVIAHRGASRAHPQNTVEAFVAAREMGADAVELDVRPTLDGELVVHHDSTLADGRPIAGLRRLELPVQIPNLSAALAACDGMWVNVEIKADIVDESGWVGHDRIRDFVESVVNTIDAGGDTERVLYSSFAIEVVDHCREMGPDGVRTAFLCKDATADAIGYCVDRGHDAIHPFVGSLTREGVDRCHQLGLRVNTWTCNDAPTMDALIEWGVDGICTDVPDLLIARLAAARSPKPTD